MSFNLPFKFQTSGRTVVIQHSHNGHIRVSPNNMGYVDGGGGHDGYAQWTIHLCRDPFIRLQSKKTGKYLRIWRGGKEIDANSGTGPFSKFKYHMHSHPNGIKLESDRFPGRYIAVNPNRTMKIGSGGYHSNLWIKREGAKQQVIIQQPQQNYQPQVIVQQEMEQLRLQKQRQILDELQMKQMRLQNEASFKQQQQQLELEKLKMQQELEIQKQELELVKQKVMLDEQKIMLQQPQQNYSMFNDMPNDGWKTKNINEWTCKELQGWLRQLNHLGIVVQLQLIEEICNIKMSGKDFNSCITANDINNTFATISKTISNKVYKCLQQIRKNTYSPELVNDQNNNYNLLLEKYNQAMRDNNALKQNMINNENQLKTEISQLKQQNETHKRNYNNLKEIIRVISEQSASLQQMNLDQENKYNLLLHKCKKATNEVASLKQHILDYERDCNELTKQNCDLNDVCNKLKMELEDVKNKYNKCVEENSDYTRWDSDTITDWIINMNKQFIQYEKILRKQLKFSDSLIEFVF